VEHIQTTVIRTTTIWITDILSLPLRRLFIKFFWKPVKLSVYGLFAGLITLNARFNTDIRNAAFVAGIVFVLLWLNSRKHVVSISSDGGAKLNFFVEGMGDSEVEGFLDNVSSAKAKRICGLI
jgi:hypothetical protein